MQLPLALLQPIQQAKSEAHLTLDEIFWTVGIPSRMVPDNANELTEGEFKQKGLKAQCSILPAEPYTSNSNLSEGLIRELKRLFHRQMAAKHVHEAFWDSCLVYCAKTTASLSSHSHRKIEPTQKW
jgi:hypothetical protein